MRRPQGLCAPEPISLVVVGAREAAELVKIVGSHADSNADNPSVLVARA